MDATPSKGPRREIKLSPPEWAKTLTRWAGASGLSSNTISAISILFAGLSLVAYLLAPEMKTPGQAAASWFMAALGIQLRLLCSMLDGMVAIEGSKGTYTRPIYKEAPDRIADVLILVGAGYSTNVEPGVIKLWGELPLGWACAVLAMGTAYVRLLQGTLTGRQSFMGPMAKQHRMAVLTVGTLAAAGMQTFESEIAIPKIDFLKISLVLILIGSAITCQRRLALTVRELRKKNHPED